MSLRKRKVNACFRPIMRCPGFTTLQGDDSTYQQVNPGFSLGL